MHIYRIFLTVFWLLSLLISLHSQTNQMALIHFSSDEEEIKWYKHHPKNGLKVMVKWPGAAYVSGKAEDIERMGLTDVLLFRDYNEVAAERALDDLETYKCGNSDIAEQFITKSEKGTSDTLKGHTVCAIFFVNQIGGPNPWTDQEQSHAIENAALNLLWWAEQAALYDVEASFELVPYFYDNPICAVSVDPTIETSRSWAVEIMENLGYMEGALRDRETSFAKQVIEDEDSDWAFIAYIIRGASSYRSNAALLGPSTTCWVNATISGYTFAHEVGHIFGLRDEYEERAVWVHDFEINGLANLNADFRNHINAPCLMKISSQPVGLCCYNAVHLYWTDEVRTFDVHVEPEDAIFRVNYLNTVTGQVQSRRLHQGFTRLPMGYGTRFSLEGLDKIHIQNGQFGSPEWSDNGLQLIEYSPKEGKHMEATLEYQFDEPSEHFMQYLAIGEQYVGRRIRKLLYDDGWLLSASSHGIGAYHIEDNIFHTIDRIAEVRPGLGIIDTFFRNAYDIECIGNKHWLVSCQIGTNRPEVVEILDAEEVNVYELPESVVMNGSYIAVAQTPNGYVLAAFEDGGVHRYGPDGSFTILNRNNGLPDNFVTSLTLGSDGKVYMGYNGGRTGDAFRGLFVLDPITWQVSQPDNIPAEIYEQAINDVRFYDEAIAIVTRERLYIHEFGEWTEFRPPANQVFSADRMMPGQWAIGTNNGLFYSDIGGEFVHLSHSQDHLQDNFLTSLAVLPSGAVVIGHTATGVSVCFKDNLQVSVDQVNNDEVNTIQFYPNPNDGTGIHLSATKDIGSCTIHVIDLNGRIIQSQDVEWKGQQDGYLSFAKPLQPGTYILQMTGAVNKAIGILQVIH